MGGYYYLIVNIRSTKVQEKATHGDKNTSNFILGAIQVLRYHL